MTAMISSAGPVQRSGKNLSLEIVDARRSFDKVQALDGLSIALAPGEFVALLGPSGCGKTTALRAVAGLEQLDSGAVLVGGTDITHLPPHRRQLGMVFQAYSLFPNMNALDNVAFGLEVRKVPVAKRRARAGELLELVGLTGMGQRFAHELSGGQQQRVALARALCAEPDLLLLDEPLSALDAKVRGQLRDEIRRIQIELGITTLFVTHDQEEALSMSDRVGVMRNGRLEQLAAPAEVYSRPARRGGGDGQGGPHGLGLGCSAWCRGGTAGRHGRLRPRPPRKRPPAAIGHRDGGDRPLVLPRCDRPGSRHPARRSRGQFNAAGR
jgi:putative spermidine/putrescine transport system ATP-binding protein